MVLGLGREGDERILVCMPVCAFAGTLGIVPRWFNAVPSFS